MILLQQGVKNVFPLNLGGSVNLSDLKATIVQAKHTSSYNETQSTPIYAGEATGYVLNFIDDYTVYFSEDTALSYDMRYINLKLLSYLVLVNLQWDLKKQLMLLNIY